MTRDDIAAAVAASIAPLSASVAAIDERQRGIAEMLELERSATHDSIMRLSNAVWGNGREGIDQRLARLESGCAACKPAPSKTLGVPSDVWRGLAVALIALVSALAGTYGAGQSGVSANTTKDDSRR